MTIIPFHGPRAMPVCRGRLQPVCFICAYRFQDHRRSGLAHSLSSRRLTLSSGILLSFGHFLGAVCTAPLLVRGRATSSTSRSFAFSFHSDRLGSHHPYDWFITSYSVTLIVSIPTPHEFGPRGLGPQEEDTVTVRTVGPVG